VVPVKPQKTTTVLALLFSGLSVVAVGIVALILRFGVETGFQTYLDASQAALHGRIMGALESLRPLNGGWDKERVAELGRQALNQGLVLSLNDNNGASIWSARSDDPQAVDSVFQLLESRLQSRVPWEKGRWEPGSHPVSTAGGLEATMVWEVFQPRRLGAADLRFLEGLDSLLFWVALGGMGLGVLVGIATARGLVVPLRTLQKTTRRLGTGDYRPSEFSPTPFAEVRELEEDLTVLAQRLARLQALRDTAGADTAHELRTPLANLEAQLEALEDGMLAPSPARFAALGLETRRLKTLVETWEDLERARTRSAGPQICLHPDDMVRSTLETFQVRTKARHQDLIFEVQPPIRPLHLAPEDWGRILVNLVENAHRHAPDGGTIAVRLLETATGTELTVDDDGPGIPVDHREAVFDRFYRVDPSRSRSSGGLGLGLSLVKTLVEGTGGQVVAEESPQGGCRIRVELR